MNYYEVESQEALNNILKVSKEVKSYAFQNLDFTNLEMLTEKHVFEKCMFLGCAIPDTLNSKLKDCLIFPLIDVPYNTFINKLYTKDRLYSGYQPGNPESYKNTYDKIVYDHFIKTGKEPTNIEETLARSLHDHSITDAMYDFLEGYEEKKVVAIVGGHGLLRSDPFFFETTKISKSLTEQGYLMVSGGGPGAMEATHVGAWMAGRDEEELSEVIKILAEAPSYKDKLWLDKTFEVLEKYPYSDYKSLGIPTWLYGHEPPTPFATHIAKYFANSIREDGILTIAKGGVIYTPGSAGTVQEIFQDATQNHYLSFEYASPMVFFNTEFWTHEMPLYPVFKRLKDIGKYQHIISSCCDTSEEVIEEVRKFTN